MKEEIIKGLNREKEILTNKLITLHTSNANMTLRRSLETRLKEIDNFIKELIKMINSNSTPIKSKCECNCHKDFRAVSCLRDTCRKTCWTSPKEPKKPSERIYEIRTTYPFSETHPRDFNKSLLEYLDETLST